ncbi:MAG: CDP-diacylglycerol--glycerol-3-phosphate 3-phosphatidyltransferase [Erysipelotrichaceae bacterium]|nr:CDP-diacylglycerol--glycerol-3-phosphate 3-phosphatidyltransferase [Erysipelotrichaceae bacterium]
MNLPNKLTIIRIILVPVVMLIWLFPYQSAGITLPVFQIGHVSLPLLNLIVLAIFAIASFTDYLDGHLARKNNLITTFGKFADPIADKLLTTSVLVTLAVKGMIPFLPVVIMLARDIIVDGCRMLAAQNGVVVAAGMLGKLKTVLQMFTIILVLLNNLPFELYYLPISDLLIWFTAFVSVAGGYSYFMQVKEFIFESM